MRTTNLPIWGAALAGLLGLASASASTTTTSFKLSIPPSHHLPNPNALPPTTHATLTTLGQQSISAPLSTSNTFDFQNVTAGSYLADIHCPTHYFAPLRVDVGTFEDGLKVYVWETYRGNDWENKGEAVADKKSGVVGAGAGGGMFEVRPVGGKVFYQERAAFSVFSILKNPMILMALVSLVMFIGFPKLIENMDPETRAEFEAQQKENPISSLLQGGGAAKPSGAAGGGGGGGGAANFDMAGFLSGHSSNKNGGPAAGAVEGATSAEVSEGGAGGAASGGKGGKKRR